MTLNEATGDAWEILRAAAAERLGDVWGGTVALARVDPDGGRVSGRNHVRRFSVARAPAGAPDTVVLKLPRRHVDNERPEGQVVNEAPQFDPLAEDPPTVMFFNEWAS